ncbi:hypothetical protein OC834_003932 [Tilletia horrida]|nr:hypothetical protein OC834_003932 [Tilletia horrida]
MRLALTPSLLGLAILPGLAAASAPCPARRTTTTTTSTSNHNNRLTFNVPAESPLTADEGRIDTVLKGNLTELPGIVSDVSHWWGVDAIGGGFLAHSGEWKPEVSGGWDIGSTVAEAQYDMRVGKSSFAAYGNVTSATETGTIRLVASNAITCVQKRDDGTFWECTMGPPPPQGCGGGYGRCGTPPPPP